MKSMAPNKRYLQHEVTTEWYAVRLYRQEEDVQFVCRRYHISKASPMRWNQRYDGKKESLEPKPHRPKSPRPNAHTEEEPTWIRNPHRRIPNISVCEMYGKLQGLQPASGIAVPRLRKAWVPQEGGICKKEVKTPWKVRYA